MYIQVLKRQSGEGGRFFADLHSFPEIVLLVCKDAGSYLQKIRVNNGILKATGREEYQVVCLGNMLLLKLLGGEGRVREGRMSTCMGNSKMALVLENKINLS